MCVIYTHTYILINDVIYCAYLFMVSERVGGENLRKGNGGINCMEIQVGIGTMDSNFGYSKFLLFLIVNSF